MADPYRMVFISIISSIAVLCILFIYFKYFAKKKVHYLFILLLFSLLPVINIFRPGSYESGDLSLHTMRTISFYQILFEEHTLPKWTPEFNVGYGDPHFLFAYFLPYFIGSLLHFIGFSFLDSIKLLLAFSFILSGVAMYLWAKDELGEKAGFVAALFYLYMPYHLVDLHFRVTIAETLSFVFLPFLLLVTKKTVTNPNFYTISLGGILYGLLILTHQIISLIFFPILMAYGIFYWTLAKKKEIKKLFFFFISVCLGFLLSAFYWIPILVGAQYTQASLAKNISSFTPFIELLYSPWRLGFLFQGHKGELSFLIGYTQLFVVIAAIYLLHRKQFKTNVKRLLIFFLALFFLLVFLILPQSKEIWKTIPLFKYAQYSYRLLEFVGLCTSIIAGIVVSRWNKNSFIIFLCLITVFSTILNWGHRKAISHINDTYLIKEFAEKPDVGMYLEPSSPIWADLNKSKLREKPKNTIEILSGNATIEKLSRTSTKHIYTIEAFSPVTIKENTLYFPGWTLLINNNFHQITYTHPAYPGIILFSLPKGTHTVELVFRNTIDRDISFAISAITLVIMLMVLLFTFTHKKPIKVFGQ